MRERLLTGAAIIVLTVMLGLTLLPLGLMLYTSLKPAGTLTKQVSQVVIADFELGELNAIGGPMGVQATGASTVTKVFVPPQPEPRRNRVLALTYAREDGEARWWTRLAQDARKFEALEFLVRGEVGGESFTVDLVDPRGRRTSLPIQQYLRGGVRPTWMRVRIPMEHFSLALLTPGRTERTAEDLAFSFDGGAGTVYLDDVRLIFRQWTLSNYYDVMVSGPFGRYFFNSLVIALVITGANLLLSSMVGYAFARREFPGKRTMFLLILGSIMIPPQVMMVPIFILMKHLNWLNTYWALIVPSLTLPFNIFMMRQYITKLPLAIEDAARIDGASDLQIFFKVILPLSKPALAVVGINTFMGAWNTFLYPFLLTKTAEMRTLPVGLALYKSLQGVDWVHLMAGSSITAIPVIILFLCFQRYIIAGLTSGSTVG
ncbi:MAG: carbohydrate ABC transporter permease [Candidatus Omnitrophica bacterium]|nr:carbohydrate ABC transporter permease [Candidatus Omnitrophota bacterium]